MQPIFAYHFLQALSFALLNSLWQMAFIWLIYNVVINVTKLKPSTNFNILVVFQVIGFAWFIYTLIIGLNNSNICFYQTFFSTHNSFIQDKLLPFLTVIYLFFAFVFTIKFFMQFLTLKGVRNKELIAISNQWQTFVNATATDLNIKKNVVIKMSKSVVTPLTIGFIKPIILIPIAAINHLSPQQLETILLHELAHIKRNDYLLNLCLMLVDTVMFFNPFAKYFNSAINIQRELSCDDAVLAYNYSSHLYADALLNVAKSQMQSNQLVGSMAAINNNQQQLKHRIKRILNIDDNNLKNKFWFTKQMAFSFLFGVTLFVLIGFINVNVNKVIAESIPTTKNKIISLPFATKFNQQNQFVVNTSKQKSSKAKVSKTAKKQIGESDVDDDLIVKRNAAQQGLQFISKLATEDNSLEKVSINNEEQELAIANDKELKITSAVEKHPTTNVQRFYVAATSKSAASIIIVTTTEKEDGKKVVKIEIEKGNGKVE